MTTAKEFFCWSWRSVAWDFECTLVYLTLEEEITWENLAFGFYWRVK